MADQPAEKDAPTDDEAEPTTEEQSDHTDSYFDRLPRRSFLEVGAAATAVGALGTASALTTDSTVATNIVDLGADPNGNEPIDGILEDVVSDGAVIEFPSDGEFLLNGTSLYADNFELRGNGAKLLPEGGFVSIDGQGWTMDGFEIDMRTSSGYPSANFSGGDYTVSRCIWRGQAGTADTYAVMIEFDGGTTAEFVDCYWPDGAVDGGEESNFGCFGSFMNNTNAGHLKLERCWFHGWSEDTTYLSEVSGTVELVDCYYVNTIVGPRVSDVTLRRVKSVHTEDIPIEGWSGSSFQQGVWLNGEKGISGDVLIEDCDFYIAGPDGAAPIEGDTMPGPVTVKNTRIHNGTEKPSIWLGTNKSDDITLSGIECSGYDGMALEGNVIEKDVTTVSGEAADPSPHIPEPPADGQIPGGDSSTATSTDTSTQTETATETTTVSGDWSKIRIEGDGDSSTQCLFEFEVSGELESLTPEEGVRQSGHGVDGSYVKEDAWSGHEEYRFTGDITMFQADGPGTVYLDGNQVTVTEIVSTDTTTSTETSTDTVTETATSTETETATSTETETATATATSTSTDTETATQTTTETSTDWNTVRIEGDGDSSTQCLFEFEVSGELESLTSDEPVRQSGHGVDGSYVKEDAWSGHEEYRFTGDITSFSVDGPGTVYLNGSEVNPSDIVYEPLPHSIAIDGSDSQTCTYSFTVSDQVEADRSQDNLEDADTISGTDVSGEVTDDVDAYRFSGTLQSFDLSGSASIRLNQS